MAALSLARLEVGILEKLLGRFIQANNGLVNIIGLLRHRAPAPSGRQRPRFVRLESPTGLVPEKA